MISGCTVQDVSERTGTISLATYGVGRAHPTRRTPAAISENGRNISRLLRRRGTMACQGQGVIKEPECFSIPTEATVAPWDCEPYFPAHAAPAIPQPHRAGPSPDPAQAHDPALQRHNDPRLQAAGERDRDADGVRGDEGPAARADRRGHAARVDAGRAGGGEEARAGADPAGRPRHGRRYRPAHPLSAGGAH